MSKHYFIIILLFFSHLHCFCQDKDVELWLSAELRKEFGNKFRIYYEQGYRRYEFLQNIKTVHFETGGYYKPTRFITLGSYYRFFTNFSDFRKNRLSGELVLTGEMNRVSIKSRSQYNADFMKGEKADHYARQRLLLEYGLRKIQLKPFVASELIFHLQTNESKNEQVRFDLGTEWKPAGQHSFNIYYRYLIRRNVNNPLHSNIIGIDWIFGF